MKKSLGLTLIVLLFFCLLCEPAHSAPASSVSQYGITWTFDKPYEVGQFVNGDYWVVGPLSIISINPLPVSSTEAGRNGVMVNPRYKAAQGYDSRSVGYDASLCKTLPFLAQPGDSILSSVSLDASPDGKTYLKTVAVLTVVDTVQAPDRFRPPYTRPVREPVSAKDTLSFSLSQVYWDYLPKLPRIAGIDAISDSAASLQRIIVEHFQTWQARSINPTDHTSWYGREVSRAVGDISVQLMLDYTNEEKKPALVNLLQYGIDLYGVYLDGGEWRADGGIFCGRKWPLLFTGIMFDNEIKNLAMNPDRFHEDGQTFYIGDNDIYSAPYPLNMASDWLTGSIGFAKVTHGSPVVEGVGTSWSDPAKTGPTYWFGIANDADAFKTDGKAYHVNSVIDDTHLELTEPYRGDTDTSGTAAFKTGNRFVWYGHASSGKEIDYMEYTARHRGLPEWGIQHLKYPGDDGLDWDAPYRRCCNAGSWAGFVFAVQAMEEKTKAKTLWNHDALFDFEDRYMEIEAALGTTGSWLRQWERTTEKVWDVYRKNYGCVWTRYDKTDIYSPGYYDCGLGAEKVECSGANAISDCSQYPTERARKYNPCHMDCAAMVVFGDLSGDGYVTAYDAALTAQASVGLITLTVDQAKAADVSADGEVTAYDAALIAQKAVGLIGKFPAEGA